MSKKVIETTFRVRYAETDASGVVYHSHYIVWFELGRGEWFWQQGRDYHLDVEARGLNWPVIELRARYMAPAGYGDQVTVRTWLGEIQSRAFVIQYEVLNAQTRQVLCAGWTKHMNIDKEWKPRPLPDDLKAFLMTEEAD